jgi:hypothetical protein
MLAAIVAISLGIAPSSANATADALPPALTQISISPLIVDISTSDAILGVSFHVTDDASGVASGCFSLGDPAPPYSRRNGACFSAADRVSGTAVNGTYTAHVTFPRYSHTGDWPILAVTVTDVAGHISVYGNFDLFLLGLRNYVTVAGTSDTTPPSLVSLSATPPGGDLANGPLTVEVTAHITDNLSGFSVGCLEFGSPTAPTSLYNEACMLEPDDRVSGTSLDGIYKTQIQFPANAPIGAYPILQLSLQDRVVSHVSLSAATVIAAGAPAAIVLTNSTATAPTPPTNVTAAPGDRRATVNWSPPASDGGAGIVSYTVSAHPGTRTMTVPGGQTTAEMLNLPGGSSFNFTVHATNGVGSSDESAPSNTVLVPPSIAEAPTNVTAVASIGTVAVSWVPPPADGGSPITGYTVTASPGEQTVSVGAVQTTATFTNLVGGGTSYTFTVFAINGLGSGLISAPSNSAVLAVGRPAPPTNPWATAGVNEASITWSAPANVGGSPILSYTVTAPGVTVTVPGDQTHATVPSLTPGQGYEFQIVATNAIGPGPLSNWSNPVFPFGLPSAPLTVNAWTGNGKAMLQWTPASANGSAIINYTVTASPGGKTLTVPGSQTSAAFDGLTLGTSYTFTIHATNDAGGGPESTPSNATTIAAAPGAPTGVTAVAGEANATVSWNAPADNFSPLTIYTITATPGGQTRTVFAPATSWIFNNLPGGISYTFTVHATNAIGAGPESASSNAVIPSGVVDQSGPTVALSAPSSVVRLSTTIPVHWSASDPSGIDHYDVQRRVAPWDGGFGTWMPWLTPTTSTADTASATYGHSYCFEARAADLLFNLSGWSSERCTAIPLRSDQLAHSAGWTRTSRTGAFAGFGYLTGKHGASMARTRVVGKRLYLVATKCPTCGSITARWNGTTIKSVSLYNVATARAQVLLLAQFSRAHSGTLTISVSSASGKSVFVEGLAVYNS